jgi:diaminopimelate decarboxylase
VGTPVYVYSSATLERHYTVFRDAFGLRKPLIAYAVKANPNLAVIATLARLGAGADTVSEGEIRRALKAGVAPDRIVFSGVGKTSAELAFALDAGVYEINVESEPELDRLAAVAASKGVVAPLAIRVNPDVGAGGHAKISTGRAETKFGVSMSEAERLYAEASASPHLEPLGLACHIGSQIDTLEPLQQAYLALRRLVESLRGQGRRVERLDLGGGLGAPYFDGSAPPPSPQDLARMAEATMAGLNVALSFEPGRVIVANAGVLLAEVLHVHERPNGPRFLVLNAAMNDLMRPAMYEAYHHIRPLASRPGAEPTLYDVVGPICESSDTFARDRPLAAMKTGDLLAFMSAGAYGASMSNEYNSRLLVPEVMVLGDRFEVVRPRPSFEEMLNRERPASWLIGTRPGETAQGR